MAHLPLASDGPPKAYRSLLTGVSQPAIGRVLAPDNTISQRQLQSFLTTQRRIRSSIRPPHTKQCIHTACDAAQVIQAPLVAH